MALKQSRDVQLRRMDLDLQAQLTDAEYRRVMKQLDGAVQAITFLTHRAPDFVQYFFPGGLQFGTRTGGDQELPEPAINALVALARELREHHDTPSLTVAAVRGRMLRMVTGRRLARETQPSNGEGGARRHDR